MNNTETAILYLGDMGALVSMSKSGYISRNPDHLVVFNSNVCTKEHKIWFGDLDITLNKKALADLAKALKTTIYVLSEYDGRFENEENPKIERNRYSVDENGIESVPAKK